MSESDGSPTLPAPGGRPPDLHHDPGAATPRRRLTEGQVSRILRLASESDEETGVPAAEGVTLLQLAEAAREAGMDPRTVERAAAVVEDPTSTLAVTAFGAPDTRTLRAFVPDRGIPGDRDELIQAVERSLQRRGQLRESGPSRLLWREDHTLGRSAMSMAEGSDGTEVVLEADRAGHYLGSWFAGVVGWSLLAAFTPLGQLGVAATVLGFLVAPFLLARPFWIRADRRRRRKLERAMMALLARVDRPASGFPAESSEAAER